MKNKKTDYRSNIKTKLLFVLRELKTEFEFEKFQKVIFGGLHTCNFYIVITSASDFKQL